MPSVADVMGYADSLRISPIAIDEDKCVAVRNRNATCRKCQEACFARALTVDRNEVKLDPSACVDCGACAAICPTSAISMVDPLPAKVLADAIASSDRSSGMCVLACARAAAQHVADPDLFVEVPCLAHISDAVLMQVAAAGFDDIVLVDHDCQTCRYGAVCPIIDGSVACATDLLEAAGAQVIVTRASSFPEEVILKRRADVRGEDRRGIILKTGSYMKRVAGNVAQKTIEDKLGTVRKPRTLKDRLGAGKSGRMPTFQPDANFVLLECLERVCPDPAHLCSSDETACTKRFGHLEVDADACSGCGLCVLFCPTGALSHSEFETPPREDRKYLEFSAEACLQCGMCADVCIRRCLQVDGCVQLKDLFDLEPALIEISKPQERASLFDLKKR